MSRYELLYIIPTTYTDDEVGTVETKIAGLLNKHQATTESTRRLGKFRFVYPIKHQHYGNYILHYFQSKHEAIAPLNEALRISPEVLRHLILRSEDAVTEQKFDLVQFMEVNIESKEDRRRRDRTGRDPSKSYEPAIKDVEAAQELSRRDSAETPSSALRMEISAEELDQKIEQALSDDAKVV